MSAARSAKPSTIARGKLGTLTELTTGSASTRPTADSSVTVFDAGGALWSAEGQPKGETAARLIELLGPRRATSS